MVMVISFNRTFNESYGMVWNKLNIILIQASAKLYVLQKVKVA